MILRRASVNPFFFALPHLSLYILSYSPIFAVMDLQIICSHSLVAISTLVGFCILTKDPPRFGL